MRERMTEREKRERRIMREGIKRHKKKREEKGKREDEETKKEKRRKEQENIDFKEFY